MPALAGLLIVVGVQAIKPARIQSVAKTGPLQTTVMAVTFVLTLLIPLQFAVLVGVGLAIILFVAQQSNRLRVRRLEFHEDGRMREVDPTATVPPHDVVVLQPYGNLSYATAPVFEGLLPKVDDRTRGSVVIVRLRGIDDLGLSSVAVLDRYLDDLEQHDSDALARGRRRTDRRPARGGRPARPPRTRPRVRELGVGRRSRAPCAPRRLGLGARPAVNALARRVRAAGRARAVAADARTPPPSVPEEPEQRLVEPLRLLDVGGVAVALDHRRGGRRVQGSGCRGVLGGPELALGAGDEERGALQRGDRAAPVRASRGRSAARARPR